MSEADSSRGLVTGDPSLVVLWQHQSQDLGHLGKERGDVVLPTVR